MKRGEFAHLAKCNPQTITEACRGALSAAVVGNRIDAAHPAAQRYLRDRTPIDPNTGLDTFYYEAVQWCHSNRRYTADAIRIAFKIGTRRATGIFDLMRASGEIPGNGVSAVPDVPTTSGHSSPAAVPVPVVVGGNGAALEASLEMPLGFHDNEAIEFPEDVQTVADLSLRELIARYGSSTRFSDWLTALQKLEAISEKQLKNAQTEGKLVARDLVHSVVIVNMDATFRQMLTDGAKTIAQRLKALNDSGAEQVECENLVRDQIQSFIKPMKKRIASGLRNAKT